MSAFLRMCFNIITQTGPYLLIFFLLTYLVNIQQKELKSERKNRKRE